ncbi:MAG: ABC transporter permease [Candidatus Omnitrophota bacterium]
MSIAKEIFLRRSLIYELAQKELKTRYRRPALGFLWTFLSPFLMAVIFYVIFSLFLKINTGKTPFFLYLMTAVFSWGFFQESVLASTTSLVANKNLIRESNFPHYLIPVSIVVANLVNFLPSLLIIIIISLFMLKGASIFLLILPLVLLLQTFITVGLAVILSIIYVKWRDIKYILDTVLLFLFYSTPVFYSLQMVKETFSPKLFALYISNPFVGLLVLYRVAVLKGFLTEVQGYIKPAIFVLAPFLFALVVLLSASLLYRRNKTKINDYLSY